MKSETDKAPETQPETPTSARDLVGCDDLLAPLDKMEYRTEILHFRNGWKSTIDYGLRKYMRQNGGWDLYKKSCKKAIRREFTS